MIKFINDEQAIIDGHDIDLIMPRNRICMTVCDGISTKDLESGCIQKLVEAARGLSRYWDDLIRMGTIGSCGNCAGCKCKACVLESALEPFKDLK